MIYDYITNISFIFNTVLILIGVIIAIIPIVRWHRWAKAEQAYDMKTYGHCYEGHYTFEYWFDDHVASAVSIIGLGILIFSIGLFEFGFNAHSVYETRVNEGSHYESVIMKGETIREALKVSDDIVNTGLYSSAINYNSQLAVIKEKSANPRFSINFTGDYDWTAIDYIDLNIE